MRGGRLDRVEAGPEVRAVERRADEPVEHLAGAVHLVTGRGERDRRASDDGGEDRVVVAAGDEELGALHERHELSVVGNCVDVDRLCLVGDGLDVFVGGCTGDENRLADEAFESDDEFEQCGSSCRNVIDRHRAWVEAEERRSLKARKYLLH